MKNPIVKHSINVFRVSKDGNRFTIVTSYGSSGYNTCYAFHGFSDTIIGRAGGCGYDKTHTALQNGIEKLIGQKIDADGGAGFNNVSNGCAQFGWKLEQVI